MTKGELQSDRTAVLETLYRQYGLTILRYLRRIAGPEKADDLLQDTFVQALSYLHKLNTIDSPKAWLFVVARNTTINLLRRKKISLHVTWDFAAEQKPKEDIRLELMREAIARLPDEHRETILLRWYDQLSYEEISHVLQIPIGTVRSRLHHALEKLRLALEVEVP